MTYSNTEQPKNSITLMNGAVLECIPKESHQGDFVPDKMKLDTTGTYLSLGNKPCKPQPRTSEEFERQKSSSRITLSTFWRIKSVSCVTVECFLLL